MFSKFRNTLSHNLINAFGFRTNRKLLIIESDDWGSIRMRSNGAYKKLEKLDAILNLDLYNIYDKLEDSNDLSKLYETLLNFRDFKGNYACITTNTIMSNPDFERIKAGQFKEYYSIGLKESYERYSDGNLAISLLNEGIKLKVVKPQFHGKEHLNVPLWLNALQMGDKITLAGFKEHVFSLRTQAKDGYKSNFMAAFETCSLNTDEVICKSVVNGLSLFKDFFGFKSTTLISPCYIWNSQVEKASANLGVKGLQGISYQYIPIGDKMKRNFHYTGQKNKYGQTYLVRNAFFEPTLEAHSNVVDSCLSRIENAFKWGKPAIIGSHRLNYIGGLNETNRDKNLTLLNIMLKAVLKRWPDIEFISSSELIKIIETEGRK